jgi:hypothetical protein
VVPAVSCLQEASEDVRTLARLWQLQAKMNTVDSGRGSAYEARIERVSAVAAGIEERLAKRLELLDGYARVMNMIEIEVEMDTQVLMRRGGGCMPHTVRVKAGIPGSSPCKGACKLGPGEKLGSCKLQDVHSKPQTLQHNV